MKSTPITDTAFKTGTSPFLRGGSATFSNLSASAATLQGSDTQTGTYTTLATLPATSQTEVQNLPQWIKLSAAGTVYALAG
ncbi:hypothetical protein [Stenotrophomonas maltophilia]|uniref:hypothetical protein n=1 Tax=Stenotrophomonas maltophilia TaxID=40324 RepID=UPI0013DAA8B0|nr:hypothetical protein [Stenotrophomonas maltophilia]